MRGEGRERGGERERDRDEDEETGKGEDERGHTNAVQSRRCAYK